MPHRPKTNKVQRVLFSIPFLIGLALVVILVAVSAWNMYQTNRETQATVDRLAREHAELLQRKNSIANAALDLSTKRGLKEEIREKFSVVKEGERVIVLVDGDNNQATSTDRQQSWWRSILSFLWPW